MNDKNDQQHNPEGAVTHLPQVIYSYPFPSGNDDEIDLGDLLAKLLAQYKLVLAITVAGTLLAIVVALYMPNIYQRQVILSVPYASDLAGLNSNGYIAYTPQSIFTRYYQELRSPKNFEEFIKENISLAEMFPGADKTESALIDELRGDFLIEILEPKPAEKNAIVSNPSRLAVQLSGENEALIVDFLNDYAGNIDQQLISEIAVQQNIRIAAELQDIVKDIGLLRGSALRAREAEIARMEQKNQTTISQLNAEISALLAKSDTDKYHMIVAITDAFAIAKKLKIKKPTNLSNLGMISDQHSTKTEINLTDRQELPLYLMGTDYLVAKTEELKQRGSNIPFVKEYSALKQEINIVENDAVLTALKTRVSDDPYIENLPNLLSRKAQLESMSLDFALAKAVKVEQNATVTGVKVKPQRALIVIVGAVVSGFIALIIGLIVGLASKTRKSEPGQCTVRST